MLALALLKQTAQEFLEDKVPRLGAALAYYTIFSIAPLLLIAIAIAGAVFGQKAAHGQLLSQLHSVLGPSAAMMLEEMIANAAKPKTGIVATIVGLVILLLGAAGVFGQLKDALNTIWDVEPKKGGGILTFLKDRFLSLSMVLGVGFLLLVSLILDTVISVAGKYLGSRLPGGEALWHIVQLSVSFGVVTILFALIFRVLPDLRIAWRDVWLGAALTSVLFVVVKFFLGLYLGRGSVGSVYGAAGSLVVLIVWIYYSAQLLLAGAEFTQVYARSHGSLRAEKITDTPPPSAFAQRPAYAQQGAPKNGAIPRPSTHVAAKVAAGGLAGMLIGVLVGLGSTAVLAVIFMKKILGR